MKNSSSKPPLLKITKSSQAEAVIRKIVSTQPGDKTSQEIQPSNLNAISSYTKSMILNNENIKELFPDIELSMRVLISSILSPNDMSTVSIIYNSVNLPMPTELRSMLLSIVKKYMNSTYSLDDHFETILEEALFTKGAYIEAIIPENVLDALITVDNASVSVESIVDNMPDELSSLNDAIFGFTQNSGSENISVSVESDNGQKLDIDINLSECEDFLAIDTNSTECALVAVKAKQRSIKKFFDSVSISQESRVPRNTKKTNNNDVFSKLFNEYKESPKREIVSVPEKETIQRTAIGRPMTLKLPVESVIPIYTPGDPSDHVAYLILTDENGVPLSSIVTDDNKDYTNMVTTAQKTFSQQVIEKATKSIRGATAKAPVMSNIEDVYGTILEKTLRRKLEASRYGDIGTMDINTNAIYRTMFYRKMKDQKTRVLFVPESSVAFYAFSYRQNGTGKSLLETVSVLISIRALLLFTRLAASVRNSITTTKVNVKLDEKDIGPEKTIDQVTSSIVRNMQAGLPIGMTRVADFSDWVQRVGLQFNFKHPTLPDMDIDSTEVSTSKVVPDTDLDREIRRYILMALTIPPKAIEDDYDSDFATTIVQNDRIFTKNVMKKQDKFCMMATKHVRKLMSADNNINNNLKETISENIKLVKKMLSSSDTDIDINELDDDELTLWLTNQFINSVEIDLPRIEERETDNMKASFDAYRESLNDYIDMFVGPDTLPEDFVGDVNMAVDAIKEAIKNTLLRKWMIDNNYMPELLQINAKNSDGELAIDVYGEYTAFLKSFWEVVEPFFKDNEKFKKKVNAKFDKIKNGEEEVNTDVEETDTTIQTDEETDNTTDETDETATDNFGSEF